MFPVLLLIPLCCLARKSRIGLYTCAFLAGFFWFIFHAGLVLDARIPAGLEGKDVQVIGTVTGLPSKNDRRTRFRFVIEKAYFNEKKLSWRGRVLLSTYQQPFSMRPGERWALTVRMKKPHGFQNPGGFDYEAWLFQERISATGYVRQSPPARRLSAASINPDYLRSIIGKQVSTILSDKVYRGIILALVNGDKSEMSQQQWQVMQQTGTSHLMAISGLHIGLVAGMVFFIARWLWSITGIFAGGVTLLNLPAQRMAAISSVLAAVLYAAMAGFSIPTQRALVMLVVVMLMIWFMHRIKTSHLLVWTLFVVLVLDPLSVMARGFWLSFIAVGCIVFVLNGRSRYTKWRKFLTIQAAVTLGLAPLLIVFYQQAAIVSPLTNTLAIPFFSLFVVPVSLVGIGLFNSGLETFGAILVTFAEHAVSFFWPLLNFFSTLLPVSWSVFAPMYWFWLLALPGVFLLIAPPGWPSRWLGLIFCLPLLTVPPAKPGFGKLWFTQLDVGQGLATIIQTRSHTMIYDTGPGFSKDFDAGRSVIIPFLKAKGIGHVDMLVISHRDNDHIGGASSVMKVFSIDSILSGEKDMPARARPCIAGTAWQWDGVAFNILHPPLNFPQTKRNNGACVLKLTERDGSILLTGDIESEAESMLIESQLSELPSDVLIVPHHGSKTSSQKVFIDMISPKLAIFSSGYRNRYHHPAREIVNRYLQKDVTILNTADSGAISVTFSDNGPAYQTYRHINGRFWLK